MLKFGIEHEVGNQGGSWGWGDVDIDGSQRRNGTHPFDGTAAQPTCTAVLQVP